MDEEKESLDDLGLEEVRSVLRAPPHVDVVRNVDCTWRFAARNENTHDVVGHATQRGVQWPNTIALAVSG